MRASSSSKVGLPVAGIDPADIETPTDRVWRTAFLAVASSASSERADWEAAPTIFTMGTRPAMPRRLFLSVGDADAQSSQMRTVRTSMPSSWESSAPMSKFMTSPA
ncbi:hypothetical protein BH23VER1_BH23VER1_29390 [soil metagenome]